MFYSVTPDNQHFVELLAKEFFPSDEYCGLRPGQLDAIAEALRPEKKNLCIMPTGSGKSFVYYFMAMMFSRPTLIISPTDLLIRNQIDNLGTFHHVDDVIHLTEGFDYKDFEPQSKIMYVTPRVMRDYSLMLRFAEADRSFPFASVVLDEVHCISSWGHDFRPDYVILAMNVVKFFEVPLLRAYTATANYTVVRDLLSQLEMEDKHLIQPIDLRRNNYEFRLIKCSSEEEFWEHCKRVSEQKIFTNAKIIGFTKSATQAGNICKKFQKEARHRTVTYDEKDEYVRIESFEQGQHNFIISSSDLGIGLDLRNIEHTIHYGIPTSISNFVQEVGRAGRDGTQAFSSIIFMDYSVGGYGEYIFSDRGTNETIQKLPPTSSNDNILALHKVINIPFDKDSLLEKVSTVVDSIQTEKDHIMWGAHISEGDSSDKQLWEHQFCLYILLRIGLIENWYIKYVSEKGVAFFIELERENSLSMMKEKFSKYLSTIGTFSETSHKLNHDVMSKMDLVELYIDWHYEKLITKHRQELKNTYRFFDQAVSKSQESIENMLQNYFSLSLIFVDQVRDDLMRRSLDEIVEMAQSEYSSDYQDAVQMAIEKDYHINMDLFLFFYDLLASNHATALKERLRKLMEQLEDSKLLVDKIIEIYDLLELDSKMDIFNILSQFTTTKEAMRRIYSANKKDIIFYGMLASIVNKKLKGDTQSA